MPSPAETSVSIVIAVAAIPDAVASAPTPPSSIAMRSSNAAFVGLTMRVYVLPKRLRSKRSAACCESSKT